jgi:hypothetical protein
VRSTLQSVQWFYSAENRTCELLWVRIDNLFIGAIYHPPRPTYQTELLLTYIEAYVDEINSNYPTAQIVIAGDVNQPPEQDVVQRTGFVQIVQQPTRGANILCKSSLYHLRSLRYIRPCLTLDMAKSVAIVQSRLDYCNSLFFGTSQHNIRKLQRIQNTLARIVVGHPLAASSSELLYNLHWLPVHHRVNFKIALLTYKILVRVSKFMYRILSYP